MGTTSVYVRDTFISRFGFWIVDYRHTILNILALDNTMKKSPEKIEESKYVGKCYICNGMINEGEAHLHLRPEESNEIPTN